MQTPQVAGFGPLPRRRRQQERTTAQRRAACSPARPRTSAAAARRLAAPEAVTASRLEPSYSGAADTYAVVELGGHQLIVEEGRWYTVNRLEV